MVLVEVEVTAGLEFDDPWDGTPREAFRRHTPSVKLTATLDHRDDAAACVKKLQAQADALMAEERTRILAARWAVAQAEREAAESRATLK